MKFNRCYAKLVRQRLPPAVDVPFDRGDYHHQHGIVDRPAADGAALASSVAMRWPKAVRESASAFLHVRSRWLLVIGAVLIAIALWWQLPKWQVHGLHIQNAKEHGDLEDSFRKTITQLLGGIAVLLGAGITYWQFRQQQQTTREQFRQQHEQFQQQQQAAQALLVSNQVSKGFEQLAGDKLATRLGGMLWKA
jgi:hypothetical protein